MGKQAIASYLQRLRELQGLSRAYVAREAATSDQNIFRIEMEGQEPRAEMLAAFVKAINADITDVYELLITGDATPEDGYQKAEERYQVLAAQVHTDPTPEAPSDVTRAEDEDKFANFDKRISALEEAFRHLMGGRSEGSSDTPS